MKADFDEMKNMWIDSPFSLSIPIASFFHRVIFGGSASLTS
jgi:hypothetical protein